MSSLIYFDSLRAENANEISQLQAKLFPAELCEGEATIAAILRNTEKHLVCNFSVGLYDNEQLVGYILAYIEDRSFFHECEEYVLYIKEIALLPNYERLLRRMFEKIFLQWSAYSPGMPLEAHAIEKSLQQWKRMARFFRIFGMALSTKQEDKLQDGIQYHCLRFDVSEKAQQRAERKLGLPAADYHYDDGLSVSILVEPRQWWSLRDEWNVLLQATPDSNVFQDFDYLWSWWKNCGIWNELRIFVIQRGDAVIGVVPMMLEPQEILGKVYRKLLFITAPMEMSRPKLLFGVNEDLCLPVFLRTLQQSSDDWDIIDIDEQNTGVRRDALCDGLRAAGYLLAESDTVCPYLDLSAGWEEFKAALPRKMRSNINRIRKRLAEKGELDVDCIKQWPALDPGMERYRAVEARSWKASNNLDMNSDRALYFFYEELATVFGRREAFELRLLQSNGTDIAATFGLRANGVFQSLKIAHDREYDKFSPGTVLESYELQELFESDLKVYEFMGSFLTNKLRWTSTVYATKNIHVYQRKFRLSVFFFVFFIAKRKFKSALIKFGLYDRFERFMKRFPNNPLMS